MKKMTTPDSVNYTDFDSNALKEKAQHRLSPKKQTLQLLMQFAKSYHVETSLPKEISGMVLN